MKTNALLALGLGLVTVVSGFAADLALGELELADIMPADDTAFTGSLFVDSRARRIELGGSNTWTLSTGALQTRTPAKIAVRSGTLRLTNGTPAEISRPAALQKAALWLDATKADSLGPNADGSGVATWYDVRETKGADGWTSNYFCMAAQESFCTNAAGEKIVRYPVAKIYTDRPGLSYVDFNGRESGSWMRVLPPSRTNALNELSKVFHVFYCGYITNAYGYLLGANAGATIYWHTGNSSGVTPAYLLNRNSSSQVIFAGASWWNGARVDPGAQQSSSGPYQYEWRAAHATAAVGNFFNDRCIWSAANGWRAGGDSVGEVAVFTNRLTEVERQSIAEYLLRRWVKAAAPGTLAVALGSEGKAIVGADATVVLSGEGTVRTETDGDALAYSQATAFNGATRVSAANRLCAVEPTLALAAGDALRVTRTAYDDLDVANDANAAPATATLALAADATVRLADVPASVTKIAATGAGTVVLSAPRADTAVAPVPDTDLYATMANGDMEEWTETTASKSVFGPTSAGTTSYHWTCVSVTSGAFVFFLNLPYCRAHTGHWTIDGDTQRKLDYANYPFQGNNVLVLKQGVCLSTPVTFPADGDYDLTFLSGGRVDGALSLGEGADACTTYDSYAGGWVKMALVDSAGVTNEIGTAFGYVLKENLHQRFRVRNVKKGTCSFVLDHAVGHGDAHTILDDFRFRRVTDVVTETTVPLPNGDFERADFAWGTARVSVSTANVPADWTLEQTVTSGTPDVGLFTRGMPYNGTFMPTPSGYGGIELAFFGTGGTATSASFTVPAGTWKLRCRTGGQIYSEGTARWNGKTTGLPRRLQAWLVRDGTESSLGAQSDTYAQEMVSYTFPTSFTLTEPTAIRIRLRQIRAAGATAVPCAFVDDLELVRTDASATVLAENFTNATGWKFDRNLDYSTAAASNVTSHCAVGLADPCRILASLPGDIPYGVNYGADRWALDICQCASATRAVTFPAAGTYRLEFSSRSRVWFYEKGGTPSLNWAGNAATMFLVDAAGATNEIYRTPAIWGTNFTFRSALFTVPAAGTYTFGIQGLNGLRLPDGSRLQVGKNATDVELFIDQLSLTRVAEAPAPEMPERFQLELGAGTHLRLDFTGTNEIGRLRLNGFGVAGYVDASHRSGLVSGTGCLFIRPQGTIFLFR